MPKNPYQAYEAASKTANLSGRELEAHILTKAAQKLIECKNNWVFDKNGKNAEAFRNLEIKLFEALRYNQQIWSVFQGELVKPDNPLPLNLRESLLNLSIFIDKRVLEIMGNPVPEKLQIIIDINLNIAAGLRNSPQM